MKIMNNINKGATVLTDRISLHEHVDDQVRDVIVQRTHPRKLAEKIVEYYTTLANNNKIGSVEHVFPQPLHVTYKSCVAKKALQDEVRYVSYCKFDELEAGRFDRHTFNNVLSMIAKATNDDVTFSSLRLLNISALKHGISPSDKINEIKKFVNSKFFLFVPLSFNEIKKYQSIFTVQSSPCPNGEGIWMPADNRAILLQALKHRQKVDSGVGFITEAEQAIRTLKRLQAQGINPELQAQIKTLLASGEQSAAAAASSD